MACIVCEDSASFLYIPKTANIKIILFKLASLRNKKMKLIYTES